MYAFILGSKEKKPLVIEIHDSIVGAGVSREIRRSLSTGKKYPL